MTKFADISLLRANVYETLESVQFHTNRLVKSITADAQLPGWVFDPNTGRLHQGIDAREKSCAVIGALEYADGQKSHETITLPGVLGASAATMQMTESLNQAKHDFQQAMMAMKELTIVIETYDVHQKLIQKRVPLAKYTLEKMGRGRLHRFQTYRLVKYFLQRPERIGFTWANTKKVEKIGKHRAARMLQSLGDNEEIYNALITLQTIPDDEPLAYVRPPHLHARANLLWLDEKIFQSYPRQVNCALPLFVPCSLQPRQTLPRGDMITQLPIQKPRKKRLNTRISEEPFLPMVNVYRYLPTSHS